MRKALVVLGLLLLAAPLRAATVENRITYEFVGFTEDGESFIVKKYDYNTGWAYSLRSLIDGTQKERFEFQEGDEEALVKKLKRKHKPVEGSRTKSPDGRFVVMGAEDGKYLDVLVMEKPRIGRFQDVPLPEDKAKKTLGKGLLKTAMWNPAGDYLVVIVQLTGPAGDYTEDQVFSWKFRGWKVKWFRDEGEKKDGGAEKPPEGEGGE